MTPEWVAIYITIIGGVGTAFNVWVSLRIKTYILQLKLDIAKEYATKTEVKDALGPLRENLQLVWSSRALRDKGVAPNAN